MPAGQKRGALLSVSVRTWDLLRPFQLRVFAREADADRPIPEWFYKILDLLEPVSDQMTCSQLVTGTHVHPQLIFLIAVWQNHAPASSMSVSGM
jgi:hypothetical protein